MKIPGQVPEGLQRSRGYSNQVKIQGIYHMYKESDYEKKIFPETQNLFLEKIDCVTNLRTANITHERIPFSFLH